MSKEVAVIVLAAWVIIETQLGVPSSWHTALLILTGLGLIVLGLYLRAEALSRGLGGSKNRPFVENTATVVRDYTEHDRKEGINSLN